MLNCRRVEQATWFQEKKIPKAWFLPVKLFESIGYRYGYLKAPPKTKKIFAEWEKQIVKGERDPMMKWGEDVESRHWIGMEINLKTRKITYFHCGGPAKDIAFDIAKIQELAELIPALLLEPQSKEFKRENVFPFKVEKAESVCKTKIPSNCGLFVIKMLECTALGVKNMAYIDDDYALDLRSKLTCEIFDQFMDKDFKEK
ncbi:hypothetical protein N665_0032s0039 [Sinapis alba]|nr:hypothetical protein N665_0032s0039 [Sinapis alba]